MSHNEDFNEIAREVFLLRTSHEGNWWTDEQYLECIRNWECPCCVARHTWICHSCECVLAHDFSHLRWWRKMWAEEWLGKGAARRAFHGYEPHRRQSTWRDYHGDRSHNCSSSNAIQPLLEPAGGGRRVWQFHGRRSELRHRMLTYIANVLRIRAMNVPRGIFGGPVPPVAEHDGYEPQECK